MKVPWVIALSILLKWSIRFWGHCRSTWIFDKLNWPKWTIIHLGTNYQGQIFYFFVTILWFLIITDKSICVPVSESGAPATLSWRSPPSSSSSSSRRSGTCSAGSRNETFASHNMSLSLPSPQLFTKLSDIVYLAEPSDMMLYMLQEKNFTKKLQAL